jgi:hypothetical protein
MVDYSLKKRLAEILANTETNANGCRLWKGETVKGYGRARVRGRKVLTHKFVYEQLRGAVPEGKELDHTCKTRACLTVEHLEPVTHAENIRRGRNARRERTGCLKGHPYDDANTYRHNGKRVCRTCNNEAAARYRAARATAAEA